MKLSTVLLVVSLSSSVAFAAPAPAPAPAPGAPARSVYRLDVSITGIDTGVKPSPATYTLVVEEHELGVLSTGANIPLAAPSGSSGSTTTRQEVGLKLHLSYALRGSVVVVTGGLELSSAEPATATGAVTLHRVHADGAAAITGTAPALLTSIYDITSKHRYEVTVAAQRLL